MIKLRITLGLLAIFGILLVSTASASAWFDSNSGKAEGQGKTTAATVFEIEKGDTITCAANAQQKFVQYKIIADTPTVLVQEVYILGNDMREVFSAAKCSGTIGGTKLEAEVGECIIRFYQPNKGETKAKSSFESSCEIKAGPCDVKILEENR